MPNQVRRFLPASVSFLFAVMVASAYAAPIPGPGHAVHPTVAHAVFTQKGLKDLRALIDSGIVMLEAEEYLPFLRRFIQPVDREKILGKMESGNLEEFPKEKAPILLRVLKHIRDRKPRFSRKGTVATYSLNKNTMSHGSIVFTLEEGVWYLQN